NKGRIVLVGTVAGGRAEVPLGLVLAKRLKIIGTVLRSRALEEKIATTEAFASEVLPRFASGELKPVVDSVFPLAQLKGAHQRMESNETFGKVVLTSDD